jgi:hypothetical protein
MQDFLGNGLSQCLPCEAGEVRMQLLVKRESYVLLIYLSIFHQVDNLFVPLATSTGNTLNVIHSLHSSS